jgi:hypothetical protein
MKFKTLQLTTFSILFLSVCMLYLSSCKKSDDDPEKCSLIKEVVELENGIRITYDFVYNENSLLERTNISQTNSSYEGYNSFIYNADNKLSKAASYSNGTKEEESNYTWEGNKVTIIFSYREDGVWVSSGYKSVFEMDENDQPIHRDYYYKNNDEWVLYSFETYSWENGNLKRKEGFGEAQQTARFNLSGNMLPVITKKRNIKDVNAGNDFQRYFWSVYEYDDKPNIYAEMRSINVFNIIKNNVTSEVLTWDADNTEERYIYKYEYNEDGYPKTLDYTDPDKTLKESYEYYCK